MQVFMDGLCHNLKLSNVKNVAWTAKFHHNSKTSQPHRLNQTRHLNTRSSRVVWLLSWDTLELNFWPSLLDRLARNRSSSCSRCSLGIGPLLDTGRYVTGSLLPWGKASLKRGDKCHYLVFTFIVYYNIAKI